MSVTTFGTADEATLRHAIRQALPPDTFRPAPWRYGWFVLLQAAFWASGLTVVLGHPAWWVKGLLGLLMGQVLAAQGFLAHEALHGALGGPVWLQTMAGWLGFGMLGVPPDFWRRWHNQVHHGHTNEGDRDPDSFGTLKRYQKNPGASRFVALAPGSGRWFSTFFLFYSFQFHAQLVLWVQAAHRKDFAGFARRRAQAQVLLVVAAWAGWAVWAGSSALWVTIVPLAICNALVQSYILTNHWLRPQSATNNPLDNSMSVTSPAWVDALHFHFSHHVEHHLFPAMPSFRAPRVRAWLQSHFAARYVSPPHWLAVFMLFKTPRVYSDATTLVDVNDAERSVDLLRLQPLLQGRSGGGTRTALMPLA